MFVNFFISVLLSLLYSKKFKVTAVVIFILILGLSLFAGTRTAEVDADYLIYYYYFKDALRSPKEYFSIYPNNELSIFLIPNFFHLFFDSFKDVFKATLLFFAFIAVLIKVRVLQRSDYFFFGMLLYVGNLFLIQEMVTIRAGVASALFLWAIQDLVIINNRKFFTKIGVALLFHYSSVIFILIWFLNRFALKIWMFLVGLLLSFVVVAAKINILRLLFLDRIFPKVKVYLDILDSEGGDEVNIFNYRIITALFFLIIFLVRYKEVKDNKLFQVLIRIHLLSLILFFMLSTTAMTFSLRTFELLSVIQVLLYPMIIKLFNPKFKFVAYIILLAFGIFQIYYLVELTEIFKPYRSWLLQ